MKITISVTKAEAEHIKESHDWYDCCSETEAIMKKIQKEVRKKMPKKNDTTELIGGYRRRKVSFPSSYGTLTFYARVPAKRKINKKIKKW